MRLNSEEIQNIGRLILSPYEKNVTLALELLQHHPYAFPEIQDQVLVYHFFNRLESDFIASLIETYAPTLKLEEHPAFILAFGLHTPHAVFDRCNLQQFEDLLEQQKPYEAYIVEDPNRASCYKYIGEELKVRYPESYHLAIPYFRKKLQYSPEDYNSAFSLAHSIHYSSDSFEMLDTHKQEAIDHYSKAYALAPQPNALYALAMFYQDHTEDFVQAEAFYRQCIEEYPNYSHAYNGLADLFLEQEKWAEAKKMALQSLKRSRAFKGKEHIYDSLGHIEWKGYQNYAAAERYFEQAIQAYSQHWESIIGAAAMLFEIKQYKKALRWYELARELQPQNPSILQAFAEIHLELDNKELASIYYQQLTVLVPDTSEMMQLLKGQIFD